MPKFLVRYTYVEETTYEQWVDADSEKDAIDKIEEEADFKEVKNVQGIEMKDFKEIEED